MSENDEGVGQPDFEIITLERPRRSLGARLGLFALSLVGLVIGWRLYQTWATSRNYSDYSSCWSNLRSVGQALESYAGEHQGRYPERLAELVPTYLNSIPNCPVAGLDTYSTTYLVGPAIPYKPPSTKQQVESYGYWVGCWGRQHKFRNPHEGFPAYNDISGLVEFPTDLADFSPSRAP